MIALGFIVLATLSVHHQAEPDWLSFLLFCLIVLYGQGQGLRPQIGAVHFILGQAA